MPMLDRRLAALAAAVLLAGCAAPGPAPVESRTRPPAVAARPVPPKPVAPVPAPPAVQAPAAAVEVEAAPIRSSGLQVRPLDPVPAGPAPRGGPAGVKQPYSDTAMADLRGPQAQQAAAPVPAPAPAAAAPEPKTAEPKSAEPAAVSSSGFAWPARGRVVQGFSAPRSMGISIAGSPGDPVSAAADGRVIFSGPGPRGYGNLVIVKHDDETLSVYAHNRALSVKEGQSVKRGQKVAELGSSGTDAPKLHFEIRKSGKPVDPQKLLPPR
jgi:lipoprotein NlpD